MKPKFAILNQSYPRVGERKLLFEAIGWDELIANPSFKDTCAIRMSIALVGAGVALPGARMAIKSGAVKNKQIEPGQAKLSNILKRMWGKPEVYESEGVAKTGIGKRSGVVSFFRIHGGTADNGHIDLIWPALNGFSECARSCYVTAMEIWFWPLR